MSVSDFEVNAAVRRVLARHWVDLGEIRYGSFRGTVRLFGRLRHVSGCCGQGFDKTVMANLEQELRAVRGVRSLFFELGNWRRDEAGNWTSTEQGGGAGPETDDADHRTLIFERKDQDGERNG